MKKFYITTSIAYVNAAPHIGFAMEVVQADVLARWHRLLGGDVFYLTGTDEHGVKIDRTAREAGKTPIQFADEIAAKYKLLTKALNISNDDFIRTTDQKIHWPSAQKLWKLLAKNGDLYKKKYKGHYCSGCESFKTEKELIEGKCPLHPTRKIDVVEEENYFFKLSKYTGEILNLIETDTLMIVPETRKNEILSLLKEGLEDVSFSRSRKSLSWGIPVPDDPEQVMYVWCDALTNYISGAGYSSDEKKFKKFWPADVHVIGKDILRFHAAIWPAMLLSAKIPLPKNIYVHGFITSEGQKMSKSLGNVVDPFDVSKRFGVDQIRFYLMKEIVSGCDGDFSEKTLVSRINTDLADDLGNLLSRAVAMVEKYCESKIPVQGKLEAADITLVELSNIFEETNELMQNFAFNQAIDKIWQFIRHCNKYVNETKPWELAKSDKARLETVLYNLIESLRIIAIYIAPFMPEAAEEIAKQIGQDVGAFKNAKFSSKTSGTVKKGRNLFDKVELKQLDPFAQVDLVVAKVLSVKDHPNADKLYVLEIDIGTEKRTICAGLKGRIPKSEIEGKHIVVVKNLKPAKLRGIDSNGMLLAADDGKKTVLLLAEKSSPGDDVFADEKKPAKELMIDEFAKLNKISVKSGKAVYEGKHLKTKKQEITADISDGAEVR